MVDTYTIGKDVQELKHRVAQLEAFIQQSLEQPPHEDKESGEQR